MVEWLDLNEKFANDFTYKKEDLENIGTGYGGWFIPKNSINNNSVCYLVGAGEDISFDCELADKYNCNVFIFDPTPKAKKHFNELVRNILNNTKTSVNNSPDIFYKIPKEKLNLLNYFDLGVWSKTEIKKFFEPPKEHYVSHSITNGSKTKKYFEAQCKTIKDIMKELGHKKIDLLKLDVEGAEYEIINSIINDKIKIKILCLEFDDFPFSSPLKFIKSKILLNKILKSGFELAYKNHSDLVFINKNEF